MESGADVRASVTLAVELQSSPWLPEYATLTFEWRGSEFFLVCHPAATPWTVELASNPSEAAEFTGLTLDEFTARPLTLRAGQGNVDWVLTVALADELIVDWDPIVPAADRIPVSIAWSGATEPGASELFANGVDGAREPQAKDVALPTRLPRPSLPTTVWVGGAGFTWEPFAVKPEDERIDVRLVPAGTIVVTHDGPAVGEERFVHVMSRQRFTKWRREITGAGSVEFDRLLPGGYSLRLGSADVFDEPNVLRQKSVEVKAGERLEVDLSAPQSDAIGSARLVLIGPEEFLDVMGAAQIWMMRRAESGAWEGVRPFVRTEKGPGRWVFELERLEPGTYLTRTLIGEDAEFDVRVGECAESEIRLESIGWIEMGLESGAIILDRFTMLSASRFSAGNDGFLIAHHGRGTETVRFPFTAGEYYATQLDPLGMGAGRFVSDRFSVEAGATTSVLLRWVGTHAVPARAEDARTGNAISLDSSVWEAIRFSSSVTGGVTRPAITTMVRDGVTTVEYAFEQGAGTLRVTPPEHPLWTFEEPDPFVVTAGAELVFRGLPKQ